jgi:hypothetical protein
MPRRTALIAAGLVATLGAMTPALANSDSTAAKFTKPVVLKGYAGGEPSLALDPRNPNNVYVTAPQFVPAIANSLIGAPAGDKGVGFWASYNGGRTFPVARNVGSYTGGGDSDVAVGSDGTVYVADLEATAAAICTSHDHGKSWASGNVASAADDCSGVTTNQQGPENDRQWLTVAHGQADVIYLTYHDFSAGFPIIERSTDGASTFAPCGSILNPSGPAGQNYSPVNGTLVAKPAIDPAGRMYVEVTEPAKTTTQVVGAALNSLYIAVSDNGCSPGTLFKNYTVYTDPGADLGKIFNSVAVDKAGNVYVIAAGKTKANQKNTNVWLFVSHDHGVHWSKPVQVNSRGLKANVMPAVVGGLRGNEVAVGWFGTSSNSDPNYQKNQWRYYVSTSFNGGRTWNQSTVTSSPIHYGDICTQGVMCGLIPGQPSNRNLADFDSISVDPRTGQLLVAFPGDPYNRPDETNGPDNFSSSAYVVRQTGGRPLK